MIIRAEKAHAEVVRANKIYNDKRKRAAEAYFKEHLPAIERLFNKAVRDTINEQRGWLHRSIYISWPDPIRKAGSPFTDYFAEYLTEHVAKYGYYASDHVSSTSYGMSFDMEKPKRCGTPV
jgi:hypothetical protein